MWMPAGLAGFSSYTPIISTVSKLLCPLAVMLYPSPEAPETKEQWMVQDGRGSGVWNRTCRQSARGTSLRDLTWSSSAQTQALALSSGYDSSLWLRPCISKG